MDTAPARSPGEHADVVREALHFPKEGHHRLCATREFGNAECDCFMRLYTPALDALAALVTVAEDATRQAGAPEDVAPEVWARSNHIIRDRAERTDAAEADRDRLRERVAELTKQLNALDQAAYYYRRELTEILADCGHDKPRIEKIRKRAEIAIRAADAALSGVPAAAEEAESISFAGMSAWRGRAERAEAERDRLTERDAAVEKYAASIHTMARDDREETILRRVLWGLRGSNDNPPHPDRALSGVSGTAEGSTEETTA